MMNILAVEPRKLLAEFIGTYALIFAGAGSIILFSSNTVGIVVIALAHGLVIAVMVSSLGHISGGLFNPALTAGLWVTRRRDDSLNSHHPFVFHMTCGGDLMILNNLYYEVVGLE